MATNSPTPVSIKPLRQMIFETSGQGSVVNGTLVSSAGVATITADAVIEEIGEDQLVITEQPVEAGATISDHAYKLPARLGLEYGWAGGSPQNTGNDPAFLKGLYQQLLGLQTSRTLCTVYTGKRIYTNMLIQGIALRTEKETENILLVRLSMQEILIATTQQVSLQMGTVQAVPDKTATTINQGGRTLQNAPNFNAQINPRIPPLPP
jgi:hypothetical protein